MNLISCEECGVVLDGDQLLFPHDIYNDSGSIDETKGVWSRANDDFVPYVRCPVCDNQITKD